MSAQVMSMPGPRLAVPGRPSSYFLTDPELGRLTFPELSRRTSYPGSPVRAHLLREVGIFVWKQHRLINGVWTLIWTSISHNERVDVGAAIQANIVFGTAGTTKNGVFTAMAVASASMTGHAHGDLSLNSASANVTTNEYTTIGLSRVAATVSTYTPPASLGATFSQLLTNLFTSSGSGTAFGGGIFDQVTVSGSHLYVEDAFPSNAVLSSGDTLTEQVTITN